jgi:CBS domain-containing protein
MSIRSLLSQKSDVVISVPPHMLVSDVVAILAEKRIGALPVIEGGAVLGIFSERDLIYSTAREGAAALARAVREVMTSPVICLTGEESVDEALSLMTRRRIRHLPVVEGARLIGFVSIGDLVKNRIEQIEQEAEAMRTYIQSA